MYLYTGEGISIVNLLEGTVSDSNLLCRPIYIVPFITKTAKMSNNHYSHSFYADGGGFPGPGIHDGGYGMMASYPYSNTNAGMVYISIKP